MYSFAFLRQGLMSPRPGSPFCKAEGDLGLLILLSASPKSCDSGDDALTAPSTHSYWLPSQQVLCAEQTKKTSGGGQ